jgi:hypothetical protein
VRPGLDRLVNALRLAPALLLLATGCVATAVYGTARPLEPGAVRTTILVEQTVEGDAILAWSPGRSTSVAPMPGPGIELRTGLEPGVDAGLRVSTASGVATDVKFGLLRSRAVAVALDPALQIAPYSYAHGAAGAQISLRLLGTWRAGEAWDLNAHLTGGALLDRDGAPDEVVGTWGVGVGPLFWFTPSVGLQPSITTLWRSDRASWHPELAVGMGVLLGQETR